jgi:hypothetical protein
MKPDPDAALAKLREIALALPAGTEKLSHGAPCFYIEKGKVYAYFWQFHHGDPRVAVIVKTTGREEQEMLVDLDADFYFIPPYLGPSGWIAMSVGFSDTDWDHIGDRVATSWEMVAPRKLPEMGGR